MKSLTIQTRFKLALHHTLLSCANFRTKEIDDVLVLLSEWDLDPTQTSTGGVNTIADVTSTVFPDTAALTAFIESVDRGYISRDNQQNQSNIMQYLAEIYSESLAGRGEIEEFLKSIERRSEGPKGQYCWGTDTTLFDRPVDKSGINWLLLSPGTRLRQGLLSKDAMNKRIDAILGASDGHES